MAEMSSSNQLAVQMPSTLESIKISMNTMVSSMAAAQTAINTGFNTTQAVAMRQAVSNVSVELTRLCLTQPTLRLAVNRPYSEVWLK